MLAFVELKRLDFLVPNGRDVAEYIPIPNELGFIRNRSMEFRAS